MKLTPTPSKIPRERISTVGSKKSTDKREQEEDKVAFNSEKKENALSVSSRRHATRKRENRISRVSTCGSWICLGRGKCYLSNGDRREEIE